MIVGQEAGDVHGLLAVSFLSLAAQLPPALSADATVPGQFYVLDGDELDSDGRTDWQRRAEMVPHRVERPVAADIAPTIKALADVVARRAEERRVDEPTVFLIVSNLSRLRDLKGDGDDYGFSNFDETKSPSTGRQFTDIVRDGPAVGIHTIAWCDTCGNMGRWLSSQTQREFEMRIAFQMNAGDSSNFIDSPAASRLGLHRAILYSHETGQREKFRPYAVPGPDWLDWAASCFRDRDSLVETCDSLDVWTIV
jgi:hypothetical protein